MAAELVVDDVLRRAWKESLIQVCRHPAVCRVYGHGKPCRVSIYTCAKCAHAVRYRLHGGLSCGYKAEADPDGTGAVETSDSGGSGTGGGA